MKWFGMVFALRVGVQKLNSNPGDHKMAVTKKSLINSSTSKQPAKKANPKAAATAITAAKMATAFATTMRTTRIVN